MNMETVEIYPDYGFDGCHFTDKGYEVIIAEARPVIDRLFVERLTENGK